MKKLRPGLYRRADGDFYVNAYEALQNIGIDNPTPQEIELFYESLEKNMPDFSHTGPPIQDN